MRIIVLATLVIFQVWSLKGQTSLKEINLKNGEYNVGFKHYLRIDSTRTYQIENDFNNKLVFRPIPISMWYPAIIDNKNSEQLVVLDYLEILKEEEESKNLPDELMLDWFPDLGDTPQNREHMSEKVNAFSNASFLEGKFPVVVYAPSYQATQLNILFMLTLVSRRI